MALVLTLMVVVLITAMVVEFSYGVYTSTAALHNWETMQRLSFISKSGVNFVMGRLSDPLTPRVELYRYLGREIPVQNVLEGFEGSILVKGESENGKFNLNSLVGQTNADNPDAFKIFRNLLKNLDLNEGLADRIADWIDRDPNPRVRDSEEGAKNTYMDSVDELLLIRGVDRKTYEKLLPNVTVYGDPNVIAIDINAAPIPVIMSLYDNNRATAEKIVREREAAPFENTGNVEKLPDDLIRTVSWRLRSSDYRITCTAEEDKIKRTIETVVTTGGSRPTVQYWREL